MNAYGYCPENHITRRTAAQLEVTVRGMADSANIPLARVYHDCGYGVLLPVYLRPGFRKLIRRLRERDVLFVSDIYSLDRGDKVLNRILNRMHGLKAVLYTQVFGRFDCGSLDDLDRLRRLLFSPHGEHRRRGYFSRSMARWKKGHGFMVVSPSKYALILAAQRVKTAKTFPDNRRMKFLMWDHRALAEARGLYHKKLMGEPIPELSKQEAKALEILTETGRIGTVPEASRCIVDPRKLRELPDADDCLPPFLEKIKHTLPAPLCLDDPHADNEPTKPRQQVRRLGFDYLECYRKPPSRD